MARSLQYEDLELAVEPAPDGCYRVSTRSPYGFDATPFALPFSRAEIEAILQQTQAALSGAETGPLREIGSRLFQGLFQGNARETYLRSLGRADSLPDRGLRIRIVLPAEILRQWLPRLLLWGMTTWLFFAGLLWVLVWPAIYEQLERTGLLKAFFAQLIAFATFVVVFRITLHRAGHLRTLPSDDFVSLRALSLLYRWFAEGLLIWVAGMTLSSLLQPIPGAWLAVLNGF